MLEGLKNDRAVIKDAALAALLEWKGLEAAEPLFEVCKTASSDQVFDLALNRYVSLVADPSFTAENRLLRLRKVMEIARTSDQKATILRNIQQTGTFLGLMYASEFWEMPTSRYAPPPATRYWNIARGHKEFYGENIREILQRILPLLDGPMLVTIRMLLNNSWQRLRSRQACFHVQRKGFDGLEGPLSKTRFTRAKMSEAQMQKAQAKADEQMRKDWKVENGLLVFDGKGYDNLCSVKQYGDIEMYVDWMLDPKGPEADAGIYLRGTPQVQIWDTARVDVGAQVGSGGLYNNQVNESKPLKVADNKLGEWNTFFIRMVGDRVTVYLNGELVTDNVIMENFWDRSLPIPSVDQIELQAHGSKVYYRNIYVKECSAQNLFSLSEEEKKDGFKVLFDGTNMLQWTGNTTDYVLEDGCISMNPSRSFGGNLYSKERVLRLRLTLRFPADTGCEQRHRPSRADGRRCGLRRD